MLAAICAAVVAACSDQAPRVDPVATTSNGAGPTATLESSVVTLNQDESLRVGPGTPHDFPQGIPLPLAAPPASVVVHDDKPRAYLLTWYPATLDASSSTVDYRETIVAAGFKALGQESLFGREFLRFEQAAWTVLVSFEDTSQGASIECYVFETGADR